MKRKRIAAIDIGTTKICSVVAESVSDGIRIQGMGHHPSKGLKKGIIVNLSETIRSLKQSLQMAEEASQAEVASAFVSVGGSYLRSVNRSGETEVRGRSGEISGEDIDRAVADATNLKIPENYEVIHILTQDYQVDGYTGIVDPMGMCGRNLGVRLHMVLNASAVVQNIINAINKADLMVDAVVMQQLASAEATLSPDEKELGTFVVDIGGGTTDIALYSQGSIWHSEVLPVGGNLITKDLAIGLKAPIQEAEEVKKAVGSAYPESVPVEELVEVSEVGTGRRRTVSRRRLCQIIQARCDEMLQSVAQVTGKIGKGSELITGVVFTGGGSLLDGLSQRAEEILEMPVRVGYPINVVNDSHALFDPAFATALGILSYAHQIQDKAPDLHGPNGGSMRPRTGQRVKNWFLQKIT